MSVSPLLVDDKVVVTAGKSKGPVLFSYAQATGTPVWQAGEDKATYASPVLTTLAGRRVILCNHGRALTAHDPATGQVLMEYPWGNEKWPKASQPVVVDGRHIFVSAGYGVGCHMVDVAAAPDGKITASEAWSNLKLKTQFNSVAVRGGFLYGLDDGRLACVDAATGERKWKEGRYASGQSLLVDDLAIVQNEDGPVHLCLALPEQYEELGRINALSSKTWNHPVLAGRFLLVRNDREAVCYELPVLP
jgi:outer membrane protein assembly factor BamB